MREQQIGVAPKSGGWGRKGRLSSVVGTKGAKWWGIRGRKGKNVEYSAGDCLLCRRNGGVARAAAL